MTVKILVVDDNQDKIRDISSALMEGARVDYDDISFARDVREAKKNLMDCKFDLMVLDMALPITSDQEPNHLAGLQLLEELKERDVYNTPSFIVGLSAYRDEVQSAESSLAKDLWSIVSYDAGSTAWREALCQKVAHIRRTLGSVTNEKNFGVDVLWLCALEDPELAAVLKLPLGWQASPADSRNFFHYSGLYTGASKSVSVRATALPHMGPVASAAYTARLIEEFRPKIVIMSGIMAGISGRVNLGDVIVANPTWDWGSGKRIASGADSNQGGFLSAPYQENVDVALAGLCRHLRNDEGYFLRLRSGWSGSKPDSVLRMHEGPVASGASVIADKEFTHELTRQHRKVLGLEMEAYSLMFAANNASEPRPKAIVAKGVCDFADEGKNDSFQTYAAYTSANVCFEIIKGI